MTSAHSSRSGSRGQRRGVSKTRFSCGRHKWMTPLDNILMFLYYIIFLEISRSIHSKIWGIACVPRQQKFRAMNGAHLASPIREELGYAHWPQLGTRFIAILGSKFEAH